jgi:ribosomal protein S10
MSASQALRERGSDESSTRAYICMGEADKKNKENSHNTIRSVARNADWAWRRYEGDIFSRLLDQKVGW